MRWLYFPLAFLTLPAAQAIQAVNQSRRSRFGSLVLGIITLYLGTYTYVLNKGLWQSETEFFESEVVSFQNNFYAGDLARAYHLRGDLEKASSYYGIAAEHPSPHRGALLINHAALLGETGKPELALTQLERAEALDLMEEERGNLYNNKGAAYFQLQDYPNAIKSFLRAVQYNPDEPSYWRNLSAAYRSSGDHEQAFAVYARYQVLSEKEVVKRGNHPSTHREVLERSGVSSK
jgi:tetratricopeptide (TPR) repeat protein